MIIPYNMKTSDPKKEEKARFERRKQRMERLSKRVYNSIFDIETDPVLNKDQKKKLIHCLYKHIPFKEL